MESIPVCGFERKAAEDGALGNCGFHDVAKGAKLLELSVFFLDEVTINSSAEMWNLWSRLC